MFQDILAVASTPPSCECYISNSGSYFTNHRFWDWRQLPGKTDVYKVGRERKLQHDLLNDTKELR